MTRKKRDADTSWFLSAVNRYEGQLVRYAAKLTGDVERARDVVQDTFLRLCREDPSKLDGHLAQWLFSVCRNRALDVRQKESRMKALTEDRASCCTDRGPDHVVAAETRDSAAQVAAIVDRLPKNQQEVIRLRFQNGLSYREISQVTGLSESNVGFVIHTAVKKIREEIVCESQC